MLFDPSCFKNLLLTEGKVHITKCICFEILGPLIFALFSSIRGTVVEENEKTQGDRNQVFGTPWPILRLREVEISVRDMCHKTAGFATCCLSLWCRRCLWRVSWIRSCCHIFNTRRHFWSKGARIFSHPNVEFSPSILSTIDRNSEIWMPRTLGKKGRSKFRRNTGRSSVLEIKKIGLENQSTFLKESEIQWLHRWFSGSRKQVTQSLQVPVLRVVEFWERWKEKKPCPSMRILQTQNSCSEPFVLWIGSAFTEQFRLGVNSSAWQRKKRDKRSHKNPWPKIH